MQKMMMLMMSGMLLVACGDKDDSGSDGATDSGSTGGSYEDAQLAADLWTSMSGYEGWNQLKDWTGVVASTDGTHGAYVQIWANDTAFKALSAGTPVPDGGIIVKEGYDDEKGASSKGLTAMQKIDGYDSANGDWFWAKYDEGGTASVAGSASGCYGCHSAYDDYTAYDEL